MKKKKINKTQEKVKSSSSQTLKPIPPEVFLILEIHASAKLFEGVRATKLKRFIC